MGGEVLYPFIITPTREEMLAALVWMERHKPLPAALACVQVGFKQQYGNSLVSRLVDLRMRNA